MVAVRNSQAAGDRIVQLKEWRIGLLGSKSHRGCTGVRFLRYKTFLLQLDSCFVHLQEGVSCQQMPKIEI